MKRFSREFRSGQRGFTLIELLIVVAILGILAAVIVPNLAGFLTTGEVAAANTEVANVESAALAYYADHDGDWPDNTNTDLADYLSDIAGYDYSFGPYGKVAITDDTEYPGSDGSIVWDDGTHEWKKS